MTNLESIYVETAQLNHKSTIQTTHKKQVNQKTNKGICPHLNFDSFHFQILKKDVQLNSILGVELPMIQKFNSS